VTTTALKQQKASPDDLDEVVRWMKRLNKYAGSLVVEFGLRAGTDVSGFSLLGHASELAQASGVGVQFFINDIPFVSCARKYAGMGTFPGGMFDNCQYFGPRVRFAPDISEETRNLLFDPQTSGGLLLAVPRRKLAGFLKRAEEIKQPAWVIGNAVEGTGIEVV
jgi:selenide, water dikinase